jgi:hypothetical protein
MVAGAQRRECYVDATRRSVDPSLIVRAGAVNASLHSGGFAQYPVRPTELGSNRLSAAVPSCQTLEELQAHAGTKFLFHYTDGNNIEALYRDVGNPAHTP